MPELAVAIFLLTYLGIAFGSIPGLSIDRTGIALLGATAMIVTGVMTAEQAAQAVHVPTILLLYALMVLSSQFRLAGFYTALARRMAAHADRPARFLAVVMAGSALLSALLANDVVCLALTPVLIATLRMAGTNPTPFLLGLAASSNIGSAATILGNPQNMLIGQVGRLDFGGFLAFCIVPALLSLIAAFLVIWVTWRHRCRAQPPAPSAAGSWPELDRWQTGKALLATAVLVALFFTTLPRELTAMAVAGVLLCSRKLSTRALLGLVDWHLITLFVGLFVVIRGLQSTGVPAHVLEAAAAHGIDVRQPWILVILACLLSNLVSNVPAVMLLSQLLPQGDPRPWYALALASTFAGNLITIGSIANLITFEQGRLHGVAISFREHARVGVPITLLSIGITLVWLLLA